MACVVELAKTGFRKQKSRPEPRRLDDDTLVQTQLQISTA
jgi:hypothetical protein